MHVFVTVSISCVYPQISAFKNYFFFREENIFSAFVMYLFLFII